MADSLFYLLTRTLNRLGLNKDTPPTDPRQWQEFLKRISNGFFDFEQERYLLERSMVLSSKEMIELNKKFEMAQATAHMGLWVHDITDEKIFWTKEVYALFGLDPLKAVPSYTEILSLIHEKDRKKLDSLVNRALEQGLDYELEFRIKNSKTNSYNWVYAAGQVKQKTKPDDHLYLSGIVMDIDSRKKSEKKLQELQEKLLVTARQAGMSEIATSVLHNIGNILNSVNVSLSIMTETLDNINLNNFLNAIELLTENIKNPDFFTLDSKGKQLPLYLQTFSKKLIANQDLLKKETNYLTNNFTHIQDVVNMQKEISGIKNVKESVGLADAFEVAIKMCDIQTKNNINIIKNYDNGYSILVDKPKLLQILVNLIKNAKESLDMSQNQNKVISLSISENSENNSLVLTVEDNGVGIEFDNLTRIFSMGFTTKAKGHGFGLHSCANASKQLGGSLHVQSEGLNKGARFVLELPKNQGE